MRINREDMFKHIAKTVALRSICPRARVGAIIVREGRILSMGYNGPVSGESHGEVCECVHAEMNAIAWAAKEGISINGAAIYITLSPCIACAKLIINSGIIAVRYEEDYRSNEGVEYLRERGIDICSLH